MQVNAHPLRQPSMPIRLAFGLMPHQRDRALLALRPEDLQPAENGRIHLKPAALNRAMGILQDTRGLLAMEDLMDVVGNAGQVRALALGMMEQLAHKLPAQSRFNPPGLQRRPLPKVDQVALEMKLAMRPFDTRVVYDADRRATNAGTRHIHHGHRDPAHYEWVGLMDGPFTGIPADEANRVVADLQEIQREMRGGKLPRGYADGMYYVGEQEKNRFGLRFNSARGSLVLHTTDGWVHWTQDAPSRAAGDASRTPYGLFGFHKLNQARIQYDHEMDLLQKKLRELVVVPAKFPQLISRETQEFLLKEKMPLSATPVSVPRVLQQIQKASQALRQHRIMGMDPFQDLQANVQAALRQSGRRVRDQVRNTYNQYAMQAQLILSSRHADLVERYKYLRHHPPSHRQPPISTEAQRQQFLAGRSA